MGLHDYITVAHVPASSQVDQIPIAFCRHGFQEVCHVEIWPPHGIFFKNEGEIVICRRQERGPYPTMRKLARDREMIAPDSSGKPVFSHARRKIHGGTPMSDARAGL
tara:strand:- start:1710 stop:2030 length:321 start_codon:yes stop_codon:yes gene_type:complete